MDTSNDTRTIAIGTDQKSLFVSLGVCPVCDTELRGTDDPEKFVCPVCGYVKSQVCHFQPGDIFNGKYRILSLLGSGGCGNIFLCHPIDDMSVRYVVKVLKNGDNPNSQRRFVREAKLLQQMRNGRIVQLIDFWTDSRGSYIVLEYIEGKDLKMLRREFDFGEESTLLTAREVAVALQFAWERFSVIHRDIKPENIMLNQDNQVKLLDFGLSKDTNSESMTDITMENAGLGSPGYMSPEQFCDFKHSDFRSDIFSLGATMVLLLTGESPFGGKDLQTIYNNTMANSPPPPEKLKPYCSDGCVELIRWMMQADPAKRPSSYSELLQAIDNLLGA